jgi:hypothetical protein
VRKHLLKLTAGAGSVEKLTAGEPLLKLTAGAAVNFRSGSDL